MKTMFRSALALVAVLAVVPLTMSSPANARGEDDHLYQKPNLPKPADTNKTQLVSENDIGPCHLAVEPKFTSNVIILRRNDAIAINVRTIGNSYVATVPRPHKQRLLQHAYFDTFDKRGMIKNASVKVHT